MKRRRIGRTVVTAALAVTIAGVAAACTGVKGGPRAPGVLVVGDSVSLEVSHPWLQSEIVSRGRDFRSLGAGACAPLEGQTTLDDPPAYTPSPWSCEGVPAGQLQVVNEYRPRTVVWMSIVETYPRHMGSNGILDPYPPTPGTDAWLNLLTDQAYQRLTSQGAGLVIVTVPPPVPGSKNADTFIEDRVAKLNDRLRQWVAAHPDVGFIDLAAMACPTAVNCPAVVDGIHLREADGIHFSDEGARWAASIIGPQVIL